MDDMNPELYGYLMEKLFAAGALDVCHIPVQMKKNRPGTRLEVLCREERLNPVIQLILTQSSAIGVRFHKVRRAVLAREKVEVSTQFGPMAAKKVVDPRGTVRMVPEYEACRKVAETTGTPLRQVYEQISASLQTASETMGCAGAPAHDHPVGHVHGHDHDHDHHHTEEGGDSSPCHDHRHACPVSSGDGGGNASDLPPQALPVLETSARDRGEEIK